MGMVLIRMSLRPYNELDLMPTTILYTSQIVSATMVPPLRSPIMILDRLYRRFARRDHALP